MSDIRLDKPATGKVQNIPCGENARFILGFPTSEAVVVRDGESLVMNFTEGGQLRFDDFYKNYGKGRLPSFVVDDTEINAKEFFTAMGEPELVPAAGPAGQASQTPSVADGARFHDWSGMEIMTGLTHLSGLDLTLEASPYAFMERRVDPFETRGTPAPEPEPSPVVPPRNPGILIPRVHDGENSFASHDIASHGAAIVVDEGILAGGKHTLHGASGTKNFLVDLYGETNGTVEISDGDHAISLDLSEGIGTKAPASSSFMVSGVKIDILGATALGNGKFAIDFSYRLIDANHHGDEDFVVDDGLLVKVTNAAGLVTEDRLNVEVHDDIPEILAPSFTGAITDKDGIWVNDGKESISGKFEGLRIGADREGAVVEIEVAYDGDSEKATFEVKNGSLERTGGEHGLFIDEEGNFSWTRPSSHIGKGTDEYFFRAVVTDADGDTAEASATVTTNSTPSFGIPGGSGNDSSLVVLTRESLLPNGTEGKEENPVYEGTINIDTHGEGGVLSIANGMAEITLDATDSADIGAVIKTAFGTFTVTEIKDGALSWRYELESALSGGKNASGIHESVEHIGIMLTDFTHADKSFLDISIDMADDTPRIEVTESGKTVFTGATVSGTVPFTYGADNGDAALVKISFGEESVSAHDGKLVIAGESGTLTVDLDAGTWSYEANPLKIGTDGQKTEGSGKAGTDAFKFEIRDADGDTKEANLEIEVKEPLAPVALEEIIVYENGLNGGEGATSGQVLLPEGYEFAMARAPESGNFDPESKSYAITETVTLEGESKDDSFVITVRDADGNTYDLVQKVTIVDDEPEINVTGSGETVFTGATASGTVPFTYGADNGDAALVKISFGEESVSAHDGKLVLAGESGTLTVDLDAGTWSYEAKPLKIGTDGQKTEGSGKAGTDAFRFEIRDTDGDTKEANLEIEVKEPLAPVALEEIVVYENGLNGGEGVTSGQVLLPGGYEFTVAKAPESGNFDPESKSYAITEAVTLEGESKDDSFVVTVRDADGNAYDLVQKVTIVDDEPQIFASTYEQALESPKFESSFDFSGHDTVTAKPSDFTADGWSHIYYATPKANGGGLSTSSKSGTHAYWVTKDGLEIIPSYVAYKYDDAGNFTVDAISDVNYYVQDYVTTSNANNNAKANKHLAMGPNGLTVGTSGTSGNLNGLDQNGIAALNDNVSEALVFQYNTPTYGLNIRFGGLGEGEKAILCFMLTPKNSNDDSVVKIVEVTKDDLNDDGWLSTDVASGFTKLIVSSAPGESGGVSSFGVLNLGLKRNAQLYDGRIEFEAGADGLPEDGGITWDWSGSGLDNALVEIQSVLAGVYRVSLVHDGNTVKAILTAIGSDKEYDGEELFTGTLDAVTGKWHIIQFLKFRTYDGDVLKDAVFNISFSVTDADGDTVTRDTESLVSPIDLSRPMNLDRFDSMEQGYYNLKDWDTNSSLDQAADFIVGNPGNTLLYGKGGNDVLIGDGEADAAVAAINTVLGTEISFVGNIAPGASQTGPNADAVDALRNALSGLDEEGIKAFEDAIEKGAGKGDDAIFGGLGNDILMGGAGDDYIDGNGKIKSGTAEDSDIILAGSGNDIIAFDANDILVSGGSGTDVLLAGSNCESSLAGILAGETDVRVHGIEVLIKSTKTTHIENFGITSQDALEDLGIYIRDDGMSLDVGMWKQIEDTDGNATFINLKGTLEIQTTLKNVSLVEGKPEITDENGDPVDIPVGGNGDIPDMPPPAGGEEEALIRAVLESQ